MRPKCPECGEVVNRVQGHYEITATSDLRYTTDRDSIKVSVAPLQITSSSVKVSQVTCPACNFTCPLETWTVLVCCVGCGELITELPASSSIPAEELYCGREGSILCLRCATRYGSCRNCSQRSTCPVINKEE